MSIGAPFLVFAALMGVLAASPVRSLAATHGAQFAVMVQVLVRCQWSLMPRNAVGELAIECPRNIGYSVSLAHGGDSKPDAGMYITNGVGTGARQVIALRVPGAAPVEAGLPDRAPLMLTITY